MAVKKKVPVNFFTGTSMYQLLVGLQPLLNLGLSQALDILGGVDGISTAADVQEVKHGKCIKIYRGNGPLYDEVTVCSICGHTVWEHYKYCSYCGAKMDGGKYSIDTTT